MREMKTRSNILRIVGNVHDDIFDDFFRVNNMSAMEITTIRPFLFKVYICGLALRRCIYYMYICMHIICIYVCI